VTAASGRLRRVGAVVLVLCALSACGKKGPPQAPLRYVPGPATDVAARRTGNEVRLRFVLPTGNVQGQGTIELDRVEVFAVTVAAGSNNPANRDLLVPKYLVATIPVRPPVKAGEPQPAADAPKDTRPGPGEPASFVEELNPARLAPQITELAPPVVLPKDALAKPAATAVAAAAAVEAPPVIRRLYVVRGLTRGGRAGQPSARVILPLVDLPSPPGAVTLTYTATMLTVGWVPPVLAVGAPAPVFNVYRPDGTTPLNPAPLSTPSFEKTGVTFGTEECFVIRTAVVVGSTTLESDASAPQCTTPADTFPPAAPKGLTAVGAAGTVNLIWEANAEQDLGGYIVLRGEAPGDTLQAITAKPITETTYQDATVKPGIRYVYVVVAVDRATPPNTSPQSNRVEETAR
jgi:hypothetical protein